MVAAALKLKLNLKPLNLMQREHLTPAFQRISPHRIVPTLVDNEFSLCESRAICIYLVEKYARNDSLYPKNAKTRATINQLIYFDMGTLFKRFYEYYIVPLFTQSEPEEGKREQLEEAMGFLEVFLTDKKFAVAYRLTVIDLILLSTISTIEVFGFDFAPYPNVVGWYENLKECAPGYDINQNGLDTMKTMLGMLGK